jgi:hypothetical protein
VTEKDKADLARWFLASLGQHPAMADIMSITPEKKDVIDKAAGSVNNRILGVACGKELRATVQIEGVASAKKSFAFFGELAMQEAMTNQAVTKGLSDAEKYIDIGKINAVINAKD